MRPGSATSNPYWHALRERAVWVRALKLGAVAGFVQVLINQGDHWLRHEVNAAVVIKTILAPLVAFSIAFASAAATHVENLRHGAARTK